MNDIKVSIIVPVYNTPENLLRSCIESTIGQSLNDIEIILVDDGSTNNSGDICDEYSRNDDRIKVIHKNNEGLSAARNTGFEHASGEWITFLDGDDWIDSNTCSVTYELGVHYNVDVVIFGTIQEFNHNKKVFNYHFIDGSVFEGDDCKKLQSEILNFSGNIATAWGKLFRKSFLEFNNLKHNPGLRQGSEGIEFNVRVFEKVRKAYFTDKRYYHYIFNPNSISAKHDEKNHFFVINCFEEIKKQIEVSDNKEELEQLFYDRFAYVVVAAAISGYFSPANKQSYRSKCKAFNTYINSPLPNTTIKMAKELNVGFSRSVVLFLIRHHFYILISMMSIIRYWQKH